MNRNELKEKLDLLGVNSREYSLYDELKPDAIVLFHDYSRWQVFYLDERGGRNNLKVFNSEEDACNHIYELFRDAKETERKFGIEA